MSVSLLEAAKIALNEGNVKLATVIKQYAESSPILENISFMNIAGNALSFNRENTLPGIGFRGINEAYPESTGTYDPQVDTLSIAGGDLDVDKFLVSTMGPDIRGSQEALKVKSLSLAWTNTFVNGNTTTAPKEFNGIKKRATGTQLVSQGSSSGGDVLTLSKLDELRDAVENPTHWIMNKTMARRMAQAARNTAIAGYIEYTTDSFGRPIATYSGLPILVLDQDNNRNQILPLTESGAGGGTAQCTSIYLVSFAEMMLQGIQNGGVAVTDLGELDTKPAYRTRVEWYSGISVMNPRSVGRLYGVKDGAVTA
jgi:hypothetical protein